MTRVRSLAVLGAALLANSTAYAQSFDGEWRGSGKCSSGSGGYTIDLAVQGNSVAGEGKAVGISKSGYGAAGLSFRGQVDASGAIALNEASSGRNQFSGKVSGRRMTIKGWTGEMTCEYSLDLVRAPQIAAAPSGPPTAASPYDTSKPAPTPKAPMVTPTAPAVKPPPTEIAKPTPPANPERDAFIGRGVPEMTTVQRALAALGIYRGNLDGAYGPGTGGAIEAWQRSQGLPQTGYLTVAESDRLKQQALAQLGGPAAAPPNPQPVAPATEIASNEPLPSTAPPPPVVKEVDIPIVACSIDGQVGPRNSTPQPTSIRRTLPGTLGSRLAAYRGLQGFPNVLVLAPRGWKCLGFYGSNGDTVFIVPPNVNPSQEGRFQSPVVEVRVRYGGTSGRSAVASTAGPLFKIAANFVDEVEANFPTDKYRRSPWPNEEVSQISDRLLSYTDPPTTEGTGTQGKLTASALPIKGVVAFTEDSTLVALAARVEANDAALLPLIVSDFEATALTFKPAAMVPPQPPPPSGAPLPTTSPRPSARPAASVEWREVLGTWVPKKTFRANLCSISSRNPPPDDYIGIGQSSITVFEGGCDITGRTPISEGGFKVSMRCGEFNDRSQPKTQTIAMVDGVLLVDGAPYLRCKLPGRP